MPLVLPLLLQGVTVNPWDIAKSLIVLMLVPLGIGLLFNAHSPDTAAHWQPVMAKISSLTILVLLVVGLGLNIANIIDLIGTNGLLALLLFIVGSLLIGMLLGGRDAGNCDCRSEVGVLTHPNPDREGGARSQAARPSLTVGVRMGQHLYTQRTLPCARLLPILSLVLPISACAVPRPRLGSSPPWASGFSCRASG